MSANCITPTGKRSYAIDFGPGPMPNDSERQMALTFVRQHRSMDAADYIPALAKLLALHRTNVSQALAPSCAERKSHHEQPRP